MKTRRLRFSFYLLTGVSAMLLLPASAQSRRTWISLNDRLPEGSPVTVEVTEAGAESTEFTITIPGLWSDLVSYGGESMVRLSFPDIAVTGVGYPKGRTDPGWWDFPAELKQARRPAEPFLKACDGSVRKAAFPVSAVGLKPRTQAEMERLGIDVSGARPGLPRLRMLVAASRQNTRETMDAQVTPRDVRKITLRQPVAPAGFDGSDEEGYTPPELLDMEFYRGFREPYDGNEPMLGEVTGIGPFSGVEAAVPVMKLTAVNTLEIATSYTVLVKHLKGTEDFTCPLPWDFWMFNFPFINGQGIREALTVKGLAIETSRSAHYLILCPRDWRDTVNPLALWKQAKGLNVDFAYVGVDADVKADRNEIDAYIENYFHKNYCHGVYVLICGDQDVIPSGRSSYMNNGPDLPNADSDHVYEVLGSDRFASLYAGRLSANSEPELKTQVDKILTYERSPAAGGWPRRVTLCANSQMDNGAYGVNAGWPTKYALAVEQTASYGGYTNAPNFEKLHAGAASNAVVRAVNADVIDALDDGRGQILYRGHGGATSWTSGWDGSGTGAGTDFTTAQVMALTNRIQPVIYAIACQNGRINQNDCIGEAWMSRANGGAVAHWGATVNSWTGENHERAKGIYRATYESGYTRLGPMLARAESISYNTSGGGDAWEGNTFAYMLLGDPEMTIRTKNVPLIIGSPGLVAQLVNLRAGLEIHVTDLTKNQLPEAFIQATDDKGGRHNGIADLEGKVTFAGLSADRIARLDLMADGFPYTAVYLQAPALVPVGFVRGGFRVRLQDTPQGTFRIYGSHDLKEWKPLGLATPVGSNQEFVDPDAP
ncbi:MAG: hypothetical protein EOP86_16635, partial [Verrucomicrobiaceae bacterium]